MAKLTGDALLEFVRSKDGTDRDEVIKEAGYCVMRGGRESLQRTQFFQALCAAQGTSLGNTLPKPGKGRAPTYRLKVGTNGQVPVTGAYTSQINVQPGDYLKVYVDDGALVLEPEEAQPTEPVSAGIASVA